MKTYLKTLWRMFSKHVARFLSIIFIVLIAVGFASGVGASTDKINMSIDEYYRAANVSDFILKSSSDGGFSDDDLEKIRDIAGEDATVERGMSVDVNLEINGQTSLTRIYFLSGFPDFTINLQDEISSVEYDGQNTVAYAQQATKSMSGIGLGTTVTLDFLDILDQLSVQDGGEPLSEEDKSNLETVFSDGQLNVSLTVTKQVQSPLLIALDGEPSYVNGEDTELPETGAGLGDLVTVDNVIYTTADILPYRHIEIPFLGIDEEVQPLSLGDIYVAIGDRDMFNCYSGAYENYVEEITAEFESAFTEEVQVITLYDNFSLYSLYSYSEKVEVIGWVLVVAFLFVTALVVYSNISRLVEEERGQIACMRTLGYSAPKIIFKYVLFASIAAGIGGFGAYFVGEGLAFLIYYIFNFSYVMPGMSAYFSVGFFLVVFIIIAVTIIFAALSSGMRMTSQMPATLLRPKPPKAGKKVILERMPWLWNLLSFKYKSTVRNVLRYMSRFLMTVVAVAISMALVTAGLALLDLCLFGNLNSAAIIAISVIIIIFAGLLTAVVIYTLTNINISERNRELATLMVLGYHDKEVSGYIYREIYIDTVIGILFGYPLAALLIGVVFNMIGLGTLGGVSWFMWLIAPFVILLFTFLVTILLSRKIVKIDMNESLKAVE